MDKKIILPLKYRPKNFEELIGQESMVLSLKSALKKNKLHNAYILTGIRGVGKTTTARIISKAIIAISILSMEFNKIMKFIVSVMILPNQNT